MRHLGRHLILVACLAATGSIASAAPSHRGKVTKKQHAPEPADDQPDADDDDTVSRRDSGRMAHESWHRAKDRDTEDDVKPSRHSKASRGTSAEDLFASEDDDAPRHTKHHVELDAPASDDDRDVSRVALKKPAKHHSAVETLPSDDDADRPHKKAARHAVVETLPSDDDEELPNRKKSARHHSAVETLPSDDEELPNRKKAAKHHSAVETLPSDDDVDVSTESSHHKSARHARTAGAHRKPVKRDSGDDDAEGAEAVVATSSPGLKGESVHPHAHDDDAKTERVAFADPEQPAHAVDADTIQLDSAVHVHKRVEPASKDWRVVFGPYLWASSVDANVSLGPTTVSSGVDFVQLEQHARYGMEFLSEAHYKQLAVYGDLMYGVVAVDGSRNVGPLMVSLSGEASSVLIDGAAGYTFYGDDHSLVALEGRAGVRYQRTGVSAQLGLSGATVTPPEQVSAGADALAGGHVVVRPRDWFYFTGTADLGVVGASSKTWSASADANVQLGSRLLLSLGYRTMTMDRSQVELVLHGPRAAFQLTF